MAHDHDDSEHVHTDISVLDADTAYTAANRLNAGVAIAMNATNITYGLSANIQAPTVVGQDTNATTHNSLLPKGDLVSLEPASVTVEGVIDLDMDQDVENVVTLKFLQQMVKCGHKLTLTDQYCSSTTTPTYRASTLAGIWPNEVVTAMTVMAESISVNSNARETAEGRKLSYSITFKEVQA